MKTNKIIREFVLSELNSGDNGSDLTDTTQLIESGVIDSMGIISLMSFIEEEFDIAIDSDELVPENFDSIASISSLVDGKTDRESKA